MTTSNRLADNQDKAGETGETVGCWEDSTHGGEGLQPKPLLWEEGTLDEATDRLMEQQPQGSPRGREDENPNVTNQRATTTGKRKTTMTARCRCWKISKNSRGLKIHQARKRCLEGGDVPQRTDTTSDETQEDPGQEAPHSAQSLHVAQLVFTSPSQGKVQIKWEALNQVATGL